MSNQDKLAGDIKSQAEKKLKRRVTYTEIEAILQTGKQLRASTRLKLTNDEVDTLIAKIEEESKDEGASVPPTPPPAAGTPSVQASMPEPSDPSAVSLRPADVVAIDLGITIEQVKTCAGYTGMASNPDVDINVVREAMKAADPTQAGEVEEAESEAGESEAVALNDQALRKQLVNTKKPELTKEDQVSLKWMYKVLVEWFRLMAQPTWRTEPQDVTRGDVVIGHAYESPIAPGYRIQLTPQQYSELQLNPAARFPLVDQVILDEFVRRLSQLATVPHVCVRCQTQLIQGMPKKVDSLFEGKLALPGRTGATKALLSKNNYEDHMVQSVRGLQFRHLHVECRVLGPLLDELVRTMLSEGADFTQEGWINDFVQRAQGLVGEALVELRKKFDWPTREKLLMRLADILENMEVG